MTYDDPTQALAARLLRGTLGLSRRLRAIRTAGALSPTKLLVLANLRRDGGVAAADLAAEFRVLPQSLTRLLASLDTAGLIVREPDPTDGRKSLIRITPAGEAALSAEMRNRRERLAAAIGHTLTPAEMGMIGIATDLMLRLATEIGGNDADDADDEDL